jgi:hypothetical protein
MLRLKRSFICLYRVLKFYTFLTPIPRFKRVSYAFLIRIRFVYYALLKREKRFWNFVSLF